MISITEYGVSLRKAGSNFAKLIFTVSLIEFLKDFLRTVRQNFFRKGHDLSQPQKMIDRILKPSSSNIVSKRVQEKNGDCKSRFLE